MGFFDKLKKGLEKTRHNIAVKVETVFGAYKEVGDDFLDELEEALISADVGVAASSEIIERLRAEIFEKRIKHPDDARGALKSIIVDMLSAEPMQIAPPCVMLVVGVNGVGKTTTIGKVAARCSEQGYKVMLCAADTFRAAAADQLGIWAERAGVPMVRGGEGADPASVVFDAIASAKARGAELLIVDTAGRLQNKENLMRELSKIKRTIDKAYPEASLISLLVLDATTGQNGLAQAKAFAQTADISGVVLTKLDGTAKGGVALAIKQAMGLPIRYIGVGEKLDDLQPFNAEEFANALF